MGRPPCCDKSNVKRGPWTEEEDKKILAYVATHGAGNWASVPKKAGLQRCGKSCRLRWTNYLRPDLKHDDFTPEEEQMIITIHSQIGSRWSIIAQQLPGRTDNDVKNYWNTKLKKKLIELGIDPVTHKPISHVVNSIQDLSRGCSSNGGTVDAGGQNGRAGRLHKQKDPRISCLSRDLRNVFMASMPESPLVSSQLEAAADVDAETSTPMQQDVAYDCDPSWDLLAQLRAVKLVADASQVTTTPPPPQLVHSNPPSRSYSSLSVAPPPQEAVAPAPAPAGPPELSWAEFFILHGVCPLLMESESPATSSAGTSSKPVPGEASGESTELQGKPADAGGSERPGGAVLITETERSGRAVFSSYLTGEDVMCAVEEEAAAAAAGSVSDIDSYVESLLSRDEEMTWEFPEFLDNPFGFGCP